MTLKLYDEIRGLREQLVDKQDQAELMKDLIVECRGISIGLNRIASVIDEYGGINFSDTTKSTTKKDILVEDTEQSIHKKLDLDDDEDFIPTINTDRMEISQKEDRSKKVISGSSLHTSLSALDSMGPKK